jgi:2-polyprenyl-3-methyl-5-hydroxy-6-metoxy-1,4-benzoquinol methylase
MHPHTIAPDISSEALTCPVCTGRSFKKRFTKGGRDFWRCRECGAERQWPLWDEAELEKYYRDSWFNGLYKPFVETPGMLARRSEYRLNQIRSYVMPGRLLDIGCSDGEFVAAAIRAGHDAEGIDFSGEAVARAKSMGRPVSQYRAENFEGNGLYDTITAFDLIEHVRNPRSFVENVRRLCAPSGVFVLTTPDLGSWSRRLMGKRWYFYIPEEHLFYFTRDNIRSLLNATGFEVVANKRALKHVSFDYGLTQFEEFNPIIYRLLQPVRRVLPPGAREWQFAAPLGEVLVVAVAR